MPQSFPLALLIDGDAQVRRHVRTLLKAAEFRLVEAATVEQGLTTTRKQRPDIVLSEVALADATGVDVVGTLRRQTTAPILVLSQEAKEHDKVAAFDAGADDYITKPFGGAELLARMRAVLRRAVTSASHDPSSIIRVGELTLDLGKRLAFASGVEVRLTPLEFKLVARLMQQAGQVIGQGDLLESVWGREFRDRADYLRVYVSQLRKKLETDPARPHYILTTPGVGYRIRPNS